MRLRKTIIVILLINSVQLIITSCCGSGYSYSYDSIYLQTLKSGSVTEDHSIKLSDFGIKMNMLSQKHPISAIGSANNLMAVDCWVYYPHDPITDIRVISMNTDLHTFTDVTENFLGTPERENDYQEYVSLLELMDLVNNPQIQALDNIYLKPGTTLSLKGNMRFIVEIDIYKKPSLTDTTNVVEILE
jgi:hypothetical protein